MAFKIYCHRGSQPSRAILIFCKVNGIDFEEITVDLTKGEHKLPEYKEINPFGQVPSIVGGDFKFFESYCKKNRYLVFCNHAILSYIACAPPGVADHCEKILTSSLSQIESVWLNGNGNFLLGNSQPSIADLSLVCEIMQFEILHEKDRVRVLTPFKKVLKWIEDTRIATSPHFEEIHQDLLIQKSAVHKLPLEENYESMSSTKAMLP
ncbi:hypothetical protein MKX01_033619 [Papaver californicum]|nr:hypothetical protein MKX01_033619 [Papaver californicum]